MKRMSRPSWTVALLLVAVLPVVWADTLELTDGTLIEGRFAGGTRSSVRFEVDGRIDVFSVTEVLALTFSDAGPLDSSSYPPRESRSGYASVPGSGPSIDVPAGTRLIVRLTESIRSDDEYAGNRFTAVLDEDLYVRDHLVAARGARLHGRLASARRGGRVTGRAELRLELTDIVIDGRPHPLVTGEFKVEGRRQDTARNTLGGALLGALIDGEDGAKTGAAAGFGLSLVTDGNQVRLDEDTRIEFRLREPLTVDG